MNWIDDIQIEELTGELREVAELVGVQNAILLWHRFRKTNVYFSEEPLIRLKKEYIKKNFLPGLAKELARKLEVSEVFVYKIAAEKDLGHPTLFD